MEADEPVDNSSLRSEFPTSLLESPGTDPAFPQLPQGAEPQVSDQASRPLVERKETDYRVIGVRQTPMGIIPIWGKQTNPDFIILKIPREVFCDFPANLHRWIRLELYRMTSEAGLCHVCRRPVEPGKKKCLEHLKDQSFRVQRDKKRRKRDARNAEKEAKRGKPENVANALEALLRSKRGKR